MRARWGCGGGPPKRGKREDAVAASVEKALALPAGACARCPFEGLYRPEMSGGHAGELLDARLLVADEHVTWREALGRDLTHVDVEGLRAFRMAKARLDAIRDRQREAEAANKPKKNG